MKVLFLDVDGVLNSAEYMRERRLVSRPTPANIDALAVPRLNAITDRTSALIVISSTWRVGRHVTVHTLADTLRIHGVTGRVIDRTPQRFHPGGVRRGPRGLEIQDWMDAQPEVVTAEQIAILDDQDDMLHLVPRLVLTDWETGLLDEHVEQCVELLS